MNVFFAYGFDGQMVRTLREVLPSRREEILLTAPSNLTQLVENLAALEAGPLHPDDLRYMYEFGDIVHDRNKRFMGG